MNKRIKYLCLLMAVLPILNTVNHAADLRVGKSFPDLVLPSAADGEPISIREFLGQKLIVQIFASW